MQSKATIRYTRNHIQQVVDSQISQLNHTEKAKELEFLDNFLEYLDELDEETESDLDESDEEAESATSLSLKEYSFHDFLIGGQSPESKNYDFALLNFSEDFTQFLRQWFISDHCNSETYYGTPVTDVEFDQLLFLDNRYESASELKDFIEHRIADGKYIFMNPGSERTKTNRVASYSPQAIDLIKKHFMLKDLIKDYEARSKVFILPDIFYDELHRYLLDLHSFGYNENQSAWNFEETNIPQMDKVFNRGLEFQAFLDTTFSESEREFLNEEPIIIPLRDGAPYHERLEDVLLNRGNAECIIFKQLAFWKMLIVKRPEIELPIELRGHSQADDMVITHETPLQTREMVVTVNNNRVIIESNINFLVNVVRAGFAALSEGERTFILLASGTVGPGDAAYDNAINDTKAEIEEAHTVFYQPQAWMRQRSNKLEFFQAVYNIVEDDESVLDKPRDKEVLYSYAATTPLALQGSRGENSELARTFRSYADFYRQNPNANEAPAIPYHGVLPGN